MFLTDTNSKNFKHISENHRGYKENKSLNILSDSDINDEVYYLIYE